MTVKKGAEAHLTGPGVRIPSASMIEEARWKNRYLPADIFICHCEEADLVWETFSGNCYLVYETNEEDTPCKNLPPKAKTKIAFLKLTGKI